MSPATQPAAPAHHVMMPWVRRQAGHLIKGFVVLLPILGTVAIIKWVGGGFESFLGWPLALLLTWLHIPHVQYIPGMGTVLLVVIMFLVGMFLNAWLVRTLLAWAEQFLDRIPLVKSIYGSFNDLIGFFSSKQGKKATQVVMVRLGPAGAEALGLLTREDFTDLPAGFGPADMVAVYVPLSYAMGGFTVMVPRAQVRPINMSMEEAMRFAVTAGMAVRPSEPAKPGK